MASYKITSLSINTLIIEQSHLNNVIITLYFHKFGMNTKHNLSPPNFSLTLTSLLRIHLATILSADAEDGEYAIQPSTCS